VSLGGRNVTKLPKRPNTKPQPPTGDTRGARPATSRAGARCATPAGSARPGLARERSPGIRICQLGKIAARRGQPHRLISRTSGPTKPAARKRQEGGASRWRVAAPKAGTGCAWVLPWRRAICAPSGGRSLRAERPSERPSEPERPERPENRRNSGFWRRTSSNRPETPDFRAFDAGLFLNRTEVFRGFCDSVKLISRIRIYHLGPVFPRIRGNP
jgi:hypothetical protein